MASFEDNLSRFPDAKRSGKEYSARCPAHEDCQPSLTIREGDQGQTLLCCHAGCATQAVAASVGLTMADLFPGSTRSDHLQRAPIMNSTFTTAEEAVASYGFGEPASFWDYTTADGEIVGRVARWSRPDGKTVRPASLIDGRWRREAMETPRPLMNLPQLKAAAGSDVYVVEGEKCVDAMTSLGLLATTSVGGGGAARLTDWAPLAGRRVIILPDNDEGGRAYAEAVGKMLGARNTPVRIVQLPGLSDGEDVADLLARAPTSEQKTALKQLVEESALRASPLSNSHAPHGATGFRPFPTECLPPAVAEFVTEQARSLNCDASFVALPVLTLLAASIGNSRRLRVKNEFEVPAILWTAVVAPSGSGKSPAMKNALKHAYQREQQLQTSGSGKRFVVCDTTAEALGEVLSRNPKGLLCIQEELTGWLGGIDRYNKASRGVSPNRAFFLKAHDGTAHTIDRRTGHPKTIHIPSTSVSITGGIQPGMLARAMGDAERASGLLARMLFAYPPTGIGNYSAFEVSDTANTNFGSVVATLLALEGNPVIELASEAKSEWTDFFDQCRSEAEAFAIGDDLRAAWNKFAGAALRLSLILHLAQSSEPAVELITMQNAITLAKWFQNEARRVYAMLSASQRERLVTSRDEATLRWLAEQGDTSARRLQQAGPRLLRTPGVAAETLAGLQARGLVERLEDGAFRLASKSTPGQPNQPALGWPDSGPSNGDSVWQSGDHGRSPLGHGNEAGTSADSVRPAAPHPGQTGQKHTNRNSL